MKGQKQHPVLEATSRSKKSVVGRIKMKTCSHRLPVGEMQITSTRFFLGFVLFLSSLGIIHGQKKKGWMYWVNCVMASSNFNAVPVDSGSPLQTSQFRAPSYQGSRGGAAEFERKHFAINKHALISIFNVIQSVSALSHPAYCRWALTVRPTWKLRLAFKILPVILKCWSWIKVCYLPKALMPDWAWTTRAKEPS